MEIYRLCGDLLRKVDKKQSNFKNAVFQLKKDRPDLRMSTFKQVYAITIECLSKLGMIQDFFVDVLTAIKRGLTARERDAFEIKQRYLFYVMIFELFYSKNQKIRGGGYLSKLLTKHKAAIGAVVKRFEINSGNKDFNFGRQNTKKVQQNTCLRLRGYKKSAKLEVVEDIKDFYEGKQEIVFDKHIPDLILMKYSEYSKLQSGKFDFVQKNLVVQTKSSCMPAYVLLQPLLKLAAAKRIKFTQPVSVMDACSAPGNKTAQLADYLAQAFKNFKLIGNDKSTKRFGILK